MESSRVSVIARCAMALLGGQRAESPPTAALKLLLELSGQERLWLVRRDNAPAGQGRCMVLARLEAAGASAAGPAASGPDPVVWPPQIESRLAGGEMVAGTSDSLPEGARAVLEAWGVKSFLALPLMVFGVWWGTLRLEGARADALWPEAELGDLGALVDLFAAFFERQVAGEEHQERVKLVGALEMAGAVCHKLNQPMQVILGYSSMVSSGDVEDPQQVKAIVKTIEDETRKMGIITKNLMGITKYRSVASPGGVRMVNLDDDPALG